jgi:hypothetical protein
MKCRSWVIRTLGLCLAALALGTCSESPLAVACRKVCALPKGHLCAGGGKSLAGQCVDACVAAARAGESAAAAGRGTSCGVCIAETTGYDDQCGLVPGVSPTDAVCGGQCFEPGAFRVTFVGNPHLGTLDNPIKFSATTPQSFTIDIEALRKDQPGVVEDHDMYVVVNVEPTGETVQQPLWVKLVQGLARGVKVEVKKALGPVRLVVSEEGYVPATQAGSARCNNSRDDDGDGYVDSPDDRGCYYANDDHESGGTNAVGLSDTIYFANPRLADVQRPGSNKDESQIKGTRVTVDRGFLLVSRVSTDGMYITDYDSAAWDTGKRGWVVDPVAMSYHSVFAFNFSTPLNIGEGDCLVQLDGTVEEFYGFTEMGKPTWKKGDYLYCAALARKAGLDCPATEEADVAQGSACRRAIEDLSNTPFDLTKLTIQESDGDHSVWDQRWPGTETERFEGALVQLSDVSMFTELRKCDRNGNGIVDYSDKEEADCSNACGSEPACQVAETYTRYSQWTVNFVDGLGQPIEVNLTSLGSIPKFNPRDPARVISDDKDKTMLKEQKLGKIVGTMRHLSFGRPPWIVEPRRPADCPDCKN